MEVTLLGISLVSLVGGLGMEVTSLALLGISWDSLVGGFSTEVTSLALLGISLDSFVGEFITVLKDEDEEEDEFITDLEVSFTEVRLVDVFFRS